MKYILRTFFFVPFMIIFLIGLFIAFTFDDEDLIDHIDNILDFILRICEFRL
jgi:hypothetical protein